MLHDFLFDIGNVILKFDFSVGVRRIQDRCSKVTADEILTRIADLTDDLESGQIDVSAYVTKASERLGFSGTEGEFIRAFENIFKLNEPMVKLIEQLKLNGHQLFLLSNTNGIHVPFFTQEYSVFDHFSGATYSHEVGCMKPKAEIYQSSIRQFNLDPTCTIYIDDLEANIVAGRESGLLGIHYASNQHSKLLDELRALDIKISD